MSKRESMDRNYSERLFSSTAGSQHVHPKNFLSSSGNGPGPMRGGIRL